MTGDLLSFNPNSWRIMWLICCFDLPTHTKKERWAYSYFRKKLLTNGFQQMQFSVYQRHFETFAKARAEASKLGQFVPDGGKVSFIFLTDKQFGMTINFFGSFHAEDSPDAPEQLLLF